MLQNPTKNLVQKHVLDIGAFYFYKNFMISEVNKGAVLTFDTCTEMFLLAKEYYPNNTPFLYLANRINSYSFKPTIHFKSAKLFPNLIGYGVVTYDTVNKKIALLERSFLRIPVKIFDNLEDAILWADEIITTN